MTTFGSGPHSDDNIRGRASVRLLCTYSVPGQAILKGSGGRGLPTVPVLSRVPYRPTFTYGRSYRIWVDSTTGTAHASRAQKTRSVTRSHDLPPTTHLACLILPHPFQLFHCQKFSRNTILPSLSSIIYKPQAFD
jgi:hypothetical protein